MRVCVFEDEAVRDLQPLTLTRPAFDLRCGALTLLERQLRHVEGTDVGVLVRHKLLGTTAHQHPDCVVNDGGWLRADVTMLVNARWLPPLGAVSDLTTPRVGLVDGRVAYAVLPPDLLTYCSPNTIDDCVATWPERLPQEPAGGVLVARPWDLVEANAAMLRQDLVSQSERLGRNYQPAGITVVGPSDRLRVDPSAAIEPHVVADTTHGPVIVDAHAVVQAFSRLEGPCHVGPHCRVLGAKLRGASLGPHCRVAGEIQASILQGYVNKQHDGFLGHSYVGEWVNFGAGAQVSDLRHDYENVSLTLQGTRIDTGLAKVGAFIGDHAKIGLGTLVNTGSVIGAFCSVLPSGSYAPRNVPSFCTYHHGSLGEPISLLQLLTTAGVVMRRRGCEMTGPYAALVRAVHEETALERARVMRSGNRPRLRRSA